MTYTNMKVSQLMSTALLVGRVDESLEVANFDMKTAGVRHLVVVDSRNRVAGLVSDRDILRAGGDRTPSSLILGAIMSTEVESIAEDAFIQDAIRLMIDKKISCLPVEGDDGQLVGIITPTDFLRLLLDEQSESSETESLRFD